ncbi:MAG: glycosyltransferase family 39 protein [Myxococcota bacterium]
MSTHDPSGGIEARAPRWGSKLRAPGCVAVLTLIVQLPFFDRWFSVMDEGHMLLFADLVTQGQLLYSDMTIYPLPGAFYLLALVFSIFEPSILVSRWLVVIEFSLLVAMIYTLARRMVSPRYAWLCVGAMWLYRVWAFPHWQMFNYSSTALVFLTASLVTLVAYFESGRTRTLSVAGLLFGLGVLCKQDYGAATLIAASLALVAHVRSTPAASIATTFAYFGIPAAAVGALAGLHFLYQGQLGFVIQMTVFKHFVGLSTYEYQAFPSLLPIFSQDPTLRDMAGIYNFFPSIVSTVEGQRAFSGDWFQHTALYDTGVKLYIYGPIGLIAWSWIGCWRSRNHLRDPENRVSFLARLTLTGFASSAVALVHWYRPQDYVHFAVLYWPLILLAVVQAHALLHAHRRLTWIVAAVMLAPVGIATAYTGRLALLLREKYNEPIQSDRGRVYGQPAQVRMLAELVDYIRDHSAKDQPVAVLPYFSIAHFLADRHGPHGASYIIWPFAEFPDRDQRIIDAMDATHTDLVIYNFTQFPNFPPVSEYAPALYDYLVRNFETVRSFNDNAFGFKLSALRRVEQVLDDRPLIEDPASATVWTTNAAGISRPVEGPQRNSYLSATTWPFREVLALRPTAAGETVLSVPLDVPPGAHLRTAVGTHPDFWFRYPPTWVRFSITAVLDGDRHQLFRRELDPHQVLEDRGWFEVDLPLDSYAGKRITLDFATTTALAHGQTLLMAGFGVPVIRAEP